MEDKIIIACDPAILGTDKTVVFNGITNKIYIDDAKEISKKDLRKMKKCLKKMRKVNIANGFIISELKK